MTSEDWKLMLEAVEATQDTNSHWQRDYALIFIAAALGMRRGEVRLFERRHFKDLESHDTILCPTLKQSEKIQFACKGALHTGEACGRICRVKADSAGQEHKCYRCGEYTVVPALKGKPQSGVVEVPIDIVEEGTSGFILDYLDNTMRPNQKYLFVPEGRWGKESDKPLSEQSVTTIFNTYLLAAGLNPHYSTHSLRHQRGVRIYSLFHDLVAVKNALRHKNIKASQVYADLDAETKERYKAELEKKAFDPLKKRKKKA